MSKRAHELSPDAIAELQQARQAQQQLNSMGMGHMIEEVSQDELNRRPNKSGEANPNVSTESVSHEPLAENVKQTPLQSPQPIPDSASINESPQLVSNVGQIPSNDEAIKSTGSYENFIEIDGLPSKGVFYDSPIMGQPLKVEDILLIQTMDESNVNQRISEILSRRIRGINPSDILIMDELYITLWLRANSFPEYGFPDDGFVCSNDSCDYSISDDEYEIGFHNISYEVTPESTEIYDEYADKGYIERTLSSGRVIRVLPRRRSHELQVDHILFKEFYNKGKIPDDDYHNLLRLATSVDIGSNSTNIQTIVEDIKQLSALEFVEMIKIINSAALTSTPVVNHRCPMCEEVTPVKGYPFRPELYLPIT